MARTLGFHDSVVLTASLPISAKCAWNVHDRSAVTPLGHDHRVLRIDERPRSFGMVFLDNVGGSCLAPLTVEVDGPGRSMVAGASFISAGERKLVARVDGAGTVVAVSLDGLEVLSVTYLVGAQRSASRGGRGFRGRRYGSPW